MTIKLNMFLVLVVLSNTCTAYFRNCNKFSNANSCIDDGYCAWCNVSISKDDDDDITSGSSFRNVSYNYQCIENYICNSHYNELDCILPKKNLNCTFFTTFYYLVVCLVYISSVLSLIEFIRLYIYSNTLNKRHSNFVGAIVFLLVTIPTVILWLTSFVNFTYYLFCLTILTILLWCCTNTKKMLKPNTSIINTNANYQTLNNE